MPSKSIETPRRFNPISVPGLSKEAVDAVNAALEAMSTWRNTIADTNAKNSKQVIEKMATAAALLGWPEQIVDTTRVQRPSPKHRSKQWIKSRMLGRSSLNYRTR